MNVITIYKMWISCSFVAALTSCYLLLLLSAILFIQTVSSIQHLNLAVTREVQNSDNQGSTVVHCNLTFSYLCKLKLKYFSSIADAVIKDYYHDNDTANIITIIWVTNFFLALHMHGTLLQPHDLLFLLLFFARELSENGKRRKVVNSWNAISTMTTLWFAGDKKLHLCSWTLSDPGMVGIQNTSMK